MSPSPLPLPSPLSRVRVRSMTRQTARVLTLVLESLNGEPLPAPTPGAHIDLHLGPGLARSYSIVGQGGAPNRYEIAVALEAKSRGGSLQVHTKLRVGDELAISAPRNLFELHAGATHSVLLAGGIGITPIWSMVQALEQSGRRWTLFFAARSRVEAPYLDDITQLAKHSKVGRFIAHFDDEAAGQPLDMAAALALAPHEAHLYCCGPTAMLDAYERATASWPKAQVHLERFGGAAPAIEPGPRGDFELVLARSGQCLTVPANRSILDVLLDSGIDAPYGCMQGVCGMCAVPVLDGIPDHRDQILESEIRSANSSVIICCSRSLSERLTIDL